MRISAPRIGFLTGLVAVWLAGPCASAQMPGAGSPSGMSAAFTKLFGSITAFSAQAEVQVLDTAQAEISRTPMQFALLDSKIRIATDAALAKNRDLPPGMADALKKLGLAQTIIIIRPDQKQVYVIYPDQKMLLSQPMPGETGGPDKPPKIAKTALGKETLDGHPCVKHKVLITDSLGQAVEATTWNATDLKEFPIQIQTQEKEFTSLVRFKQVQLAKPDAAEFEPPADYARYKDKDELDQAIRKKMESKGKD